MAYLWAAAHNHHGWAPTINPFILRIFTSSDIHLDFDENRRWFNDISSADYTEDLLMLGGDISHEYKLFEQALAQLKQKFKHVCFVPGNHDLWIDDQWFANSYDKHLYLQNYCASIGVVTTPMDFGRFRVLPLLSWYDYSFGQPNEDLKQAWVDFEAFQWPESHVVDPAPLYFMNQNTEYLQPHEVPVISFSHFMPRLDLLSNKVNAKTYFLNPVLGSTRLDEQIRQANASIHVYGHYHVNNWQLQQGVLYINNAYGYPKEKHLTNKCLLEIKLDEVLQGTNDL